MGCGASKISAIEAISKKQGKPNISSSEEESEERRPLSFTILPGFMLFNSKGQPKRSKSSIPSSGSRPSRLGTPIQSNQRKNAHGSRRQSGFPQLRYPEISLQQKQPYQNTQSICSSVDSSLHSKRVEQAETIKQEKVTPTSKLGSLGIKNLQKKGIALSKFITHENPNKTGRVEQGKDITPNRNFNHSRYNRQLAPSARRKRSRSRSNQGDDEQGLRASMCEVKYKMPVLDKKQSSFDFRKANGITKARERLLKETNNIIFSSQSKANIKNEDISHSISNLMDEVENDTNRLQSMKGQMFNRLQPPQLAKQKLPNWATSMRNRNFTTSTFELQHTNPSSVSMIKNVLPQEKAQQRNKSIFHKENKIGVRVVPGKQSCQESSYSGSDLSHLIDSSSNDSILGSSEIVPLKRRSHIKSDLEQQCNRKALAEKLFGLDLKGINPDLKVSEETTEKNEFSNKKLIKRYEMISLLGSGAYAEVMKAKDIDTKEIYVRYRI